MPPKIKIKRLEGYDPQVPLPFYASSGAAGADVRANFTEADRDGVLLAPGDRTLVPTGIAMEIPQGYEVQVRPRSGLALKHGIALVNAPGTIDCDYRGHLGIIVVNLGRDAYKIEHGERVAQLIVAEFAQAEFEGAEALSSSERGAEGFGSTGKS